jgi:hypothetical protein
MSLTTDRRLLGVADHAIGDATTATALAGGLLIAACIHLTLAVEHGVSTFAALAAIAGAAQAALAVGALRGNGRSIARAAMLLSLVLIQLYVLNVTVGLPTVIAHTHVPGTHTVLGLTLALPNTIDAVGLLAQLAQGVTVVAAAGLRRSPVDLRAS